MTIVKTSLHVLGLASLAVFASAAPVGALDPLATERAISDRMTTSRDRGWAVLPQIGYSPEKSGNAGIKLAVHDLPPARLSVDLEALYAMMGQHEGSVTLLAPELAGGLLLALIAGEFELDPTKEFFGLGNNDAGPEELSTHEQQAAGVLATIGLRPLPRLSLALSAGLRHVDVRHGKLEGDTPSTRREFPNLTGIDGGNTNPLAISVAWNTREDPARPTRGWAILGKVQRVNEALDNDFEFTRIAGEASYLFPLLTRRQVIGFRVAGQHVEGDRGEVPFWEMASLGSSRDLRGYFQDRFLGRSLLLAGAEYRLKIVDFDFFDIWDVEIDGVVFGDVGRVFLDDADLRAESGCSDPGPLPLPPAEPCRELPPTNDDLRFSWGGGPRFALGKALVARIDVGFSEEEKGLVYLTFGQTF